jgi:transposase
MTAERSENAIQMPGTGTRRKHSIQYKLQVVREALQPGTSIREVARRHGLHVSLIGVWRRQHAQEPLPEARDSVALPILLPVQVSAELQGRSGGGEAAIAAHSVAGGSIHIEFSHGHRLSVRGEMDANALSAMIRKLTRS